MSVYILAEVGSTCDGSVGQMLAMIDAIADAGCDALKAQDHLGERIKGDPPWFKPGHETREQYLKRTQFSDIEWQLIRARCTERGVDLVVSPFSVEAVRRLELVPVDGYKVASGQVTNLEMLQAIQTATMPPGKHFGCCSPPRVPTKKVILSNGMCTREELAAAMAMTRPWAILQCTSEYPCAPERVGLNELELMLAPSVRGLNGLPADLSDDDHKFTMRLARNGVTRFGLSDHTLGMAASLAAITLGATVIERHVCFDRRGYGSDAKHSLTIDELAAFVREVRDLEKMLANPVDKDELAVTPAMLEMRKAFLE